MVVADCGLPIPDGMPVIDLALVHGVPRLKQTLDALLEGLVIDTCTAAEDIRGTAVEPWLTGRFAAGPSMRLCVSKRAGERTDNFIKLLHV